MAHKLTTGQTKFPLHYFLHILCGGLWLLTLLAQAEEDVSFTHAIAIHGQPRHGPDMKHFDYVNPQAPKGGSFRQAQIGNFDTFHLYGPNGKAPHFLFFTYETLLTRSWDEPLTKYGVLVKTIEEPKDKSWVAFHLHPEARFHDGKPITAEDVVFTFYKLTDEGGLFWRQFYQDVEKVEATSRQRVLFTFKHNRNRELALTLGQMPVLPSHWWQGRDFTATTLDIPVGSGPYRVKRYKPGRYVEYERVRDYWAKDHPVNVGRFNFDTVRTEFYGDVNVVIEAMNSGLLDIRLESDARYWNSGYSRSALNEGRLVKKLWPNHNPQTQSLVINSRRPWLNDIRVREALAVLLELDWVLDKLLDGTMNRATSLFAGTELAAPPIAGPDERELVDAFHNQIPSRFYSENWPPAQTLSKRERLKYALNLLQQAGFTLDNGTLLTPAGKPFTLELMLTDPTLERLMQSQVRRFASAGIQLSLRTVESARYLKYVRALDFELIIHTFRHTPVPGSEQRSFWGSENSNEPGTLNLAGVQHPAIDHLTDRIPQTRSWQELLTTIRAMDRLLLWQFQVIPLSYAPNWQVIVSDRMVLPATKPRYTFDRSTWWSTAAQSAATLNQSENNHDRRK
ncbi:extracellular solute-binding protein [Parendozoicomonas haliclonae]|uniref:Oligopeptide-binding protein AppA n=1 Tax=Parendozoicomonas haliclonae TaxID=1960125 RepID=A0A1X7AM09_9GAMM|nr:extracellular solute-binding protein [Parendozoicomonas haliclonae]SMA49141.1 Oligopeptide-binding protein AppA precursor [Parendozoicomonas haliclonae]